MLVIIKVACFSLNLDLQVLRLTNKTIHKTLQSIKGEADYEILPNYYHKPPTFIIMNFCNCAMKWIPINCILTKT